MLYSGSQTLCVLAAEGSSTCGNERASGSETTSTGPVDGEGTGKKKLKCDVSSVLALRMSLGIVLTSPNINI